MSRFPPSQTKYISIAGAAKQPAIDRLKQSKLHIMLAVDNDAAGQKCRDKLSVTST